MTPALPPLPPLSPPPLSPLSGLVQRVLGVAARTVSEGSRRNARSALQYRDDLDRDGAEVMAAITPGRVPRQRLERRPSA